MIRIDTMLQAVEEAGKTCEYWMLLETGQVLHKEIMIALANKHDQELTLPDEGFYMVSKEGAIGIAVRYEYLTQWLFLPAEPEAIERGRIEDENAMYLEAIRTMPDSGQQVDADQGEARFCGDCGAPLSPGVKFCTVCGRKQG